jgi:hypothetical protein
MEHDVRTWEGAIRPKLKGVHERCGGSVWVMILTTRTFCTLVLRFAGIF